MRFKHLDSASLTDVLRGTEGIGMAESTNGTAEVWGRNLNDLFVVHHKTDNESVQQLKIWWIAASLFFRNSREPICWRGVRGLSVRLIFLTA